MKYEKMNLRQLRTAIRCIHPNVPMSSFECVNLNDGKGLHVRRWTHAKTAPTRAEIEAASETPAFAEMMAIIDARDERRRSYPRIADQLDALWKGGEAEEAMRERVLAVKAENPYPEPVAWERVDNRIRPVEK